MGEEDEAGGVRGKLRGEGREVSVDCWGVGVFGGGGVDFLSFLVDFVWGVLVVVGGGGAGGRRGCTDYGLGLGGAGGA